MMCSFPRLVTRNRSLKCLPLYFMVIHVYWVISPSLFCVPSMFQTIIFLGSLAVGILCFLMNPCSIKIPCAPESMRAFVSTFFSSDAVIEIGMRIDCSIGSA